MKIENLTNEDVQFINQTAQNIMRILNSQKIIIWSWGFHRPKAELFNGMASLSFSVNGFRHKGRVVVAYNEGSDLFEIYLINKKSNNIGSVRDVYFDKLVSVCDSLIETDNDQSSEYRQKVAKATYKI